MKTENQKSMKCKEILKFLENNKTKVVESKDLRANYYLFVNDTIYLSGNKKSCAKTNKRQHEEVSSYIVMCHECIHAIQSKKLHLMNVTFSNAELLLFFSLLIMRLMKNNINILYSIYFFVLLFSIILRLFLELNAIKRSVVLAKELVHKKIEEDVKEEEVNNIIIKMKKLLPVEIIRIIFPKLARSLIILLLK